MPRRTNPHVDEAIFRRLEQLPPDHPAATPRMLTSMQEQVLPALMWLFDSQRNRAEGRSTVLAHVAIRLAMQGETVRLDDVSQALTGRQELHRRSGLFRALVFDVIREHYRGHRFDWGHENMLFYRGKHPR